jgi:acetolactate synthase-1/2/3 large subunit
MGGDYTRFRDPEMIRPGDQTLVQVDIDPRNAGWVYPVDLAITGDVVDVITMLKNVDLSNTKRDLRLDSIKTIKEENGYNELPDLPAADGTLHQSDLIRGIQGFLEAKDMLTLDAGSNRLWATYGLRMPHPQQLIVPGGTGIMGWGIPAAAAAKLVHPNKRVTSFSGDGGFMMTMQTITTCIQQSLDTVFLVSNNSGLGMVRDNLGEKRIAVDFADIDFATIAEGMGGKGLRISHKDEVRDALEEAHKLGGPVVIDAKVDVKASHHEVVDNAPLH